MSDEENMREEAAFKAWFLSSKYGQVIYPQKSHEVIASDGWKSCAAIKDAEIAEYKKGSTFWKTAYHELQEVKDAEIAARDLMIKELREVVEGISREIGYEWLLDIFNPARDALAKSEHHNSRALEKMLLEAEINALKQAAEMCIPYDQEFQHLITNRQAKLAELNKE